MMKIDVDEHILEVTPKEVDFIRDFCQKTGGSVPNIMAFLMVYKNMYKGDD